MGKKSKLATINGNKIEPVDLKLTIQKDMDMKGSDEMKDRIPLIIDEIKKILKSKNLSF